MTLRGPARPVAIVVAVQEEAQAVLMKLLPKTRGRLGRFPFWRGTMGRREVSLLQCGPGLARAAEAARVMVERQDPIAILSAGLAGGLAADQKQGDLLLGTRVLSSDGTGEKPSVWEAAPDIVAAARRAAEELKELGQIRRGGGPRKEYRISEVTLVSRDRVLVTAEDKRLAARVTHAQAVDMESRAVVAVAQEKKVPWLAVRVISDTVDEDLPLDFNRFMGPNGEPQKLKILLEGIKRPMVLGRLIAMEKTTQLAGQHLAEYLELLMPELAPEP